MSRPLRVITAGAGLGGLAAALAFARAGAEVTLVERAPELREVGAGIQLSPNAMKALDWLGVGARVRGSSFAPEALELRAWRSGRVVYRTPLGAAIIARHGADYRQAHRADIHAALALECRAAGVDIRLGETVTGHEDGALITDKGAHAGDLIIGADGVRSVLRQALCPGSEPVFAGHAAWRGVVRADRLPPGLVRPNATVWMGPRRHFVHYYLRDGELVNFVAIEERRDWIEEGWTLPGDIHDLRDGFAQWHETVRAILAVADKTFLWGLFGHPTLARWSRGNLVLLGDACHPTTPFLAQGAAMAFEDAVVLARAVAARGATPAALAAYETARKPRATRLQAAALRTGARFHSRSLPERLAKFAAIEALTRFAPARAAALNDWIYSYDPGSAAI